MPSHPLTRARERRRTKRLARAVLATLVAATVASACSDDSTVTTPPVVTAPATSPAPSTTAAGPTSSVPGTAPAVTTTVAPNSTVPLGQIRIGLAPVATLASPIAMAMRAGSALAYIAERSGTVRTVDLATGAVSPPVVDISGDISNGGERGLLGLAFSPDGGRLYLSYTNTQGNSRIDEITMRGDAADLATRRNVLAQNQPFANHNGGNVVFGPDGYLWFGFGDGGGQNDPNNNAQNLNSLLGKIIRIDPSAQAGGAAYGVPADNPFIAGGGRPEIWISGVRNPWRFSFDRQTGDLWIGDVGGDALEEIDVLTAAAGRGRGVNLGWPAVEGTRANKGSAPSGAVGPVAVYDHTGGDCAVTGGYVYRGAAVAAMRGVYLFADECGGRLRLARLADGAAQAETVITNVAVPGAQPASFGQDQAGELYVLSLSGGLFRIVGA